MNLVAIAVVTTLLLAGCSTTRMIETVAILLALLEKYRADSLAQILSASAL